MAEYAGRLSMTEAGHAHLGATATPEPGKRTLTEQQRGDATSMPVHHRAPDSRGADEPAPMNRPEGSLPTIQALFGGHLQRHVTKAPEGNGYGPGSNPDGTALVGGIQERSTDVPHRAQMERAFRQDFSSVRAEIGQSDAMTAIGATAAARGESVAFSDSKPSPWLVAHELTHVVQHRQSRGGRDSKACKTTIASVDNAPEREANRVADRVAAGEPAGPITARPVADIHRFAPVGHRQSTIDGLKGTFSSEEIADIYASNWERDFSQGHPDIASAALAWTAVKNHAAKHNGDPGPEAATFQSAVWKVVNGYLTDSRDESLGGYKTWEHMDQPDTLPSKAAEERWQHGTPGLAGYLQDAKAYIKDQLVAAIDRYRAAHRMNTVGDGINNWAGGAKPGGYVSPSVTISRDGKTVISTLPRGFNDSRVASRDPVREETVMEATAAGAKSDPNYSGSFRMVGQHLGRAMHAFQDFWAHSNWLDMARAAHQKESQGKPIASGAEANKGLMTGTFTLPAQAHALGHKLLALATAFKKDFLLLLKVYGRAEASTKIDSTEAKTYRSTIWGGSPIEERLNDHDMAYSPLREDSYFTWAEIADVGEATNNVEELVLSGKYKMEDFLCNQNWLDALANKGRLLIKQGADNSPANSHGKIAKDQEETGSNKDYNAALALSKAADEMAFGPVRAMMDEKDPGKALAATHAQLARIDKMLQAPTPSHPLWNMVK